MLFIYSNILPFFRNYLEFFRHFNVSYGVKYLHFFSFVFLRNLSNIGRNTHQCLFLKNQCSLSQLKNLSAVKKVCKS